MDGVVWYGGIAFLVSRTHVGSLMSGMWGLGLLLETIGCAASGSSHWGGAMQMTATHVCVLGMCGRDTGLVGGAWVGLVLG